jgi:hypothetical protein
MRALFRVTKWERVSPWRRAIGAVTRVGLLIAFLVILFNLLAPPIGILVAVRMAAKKAPAVKVTPLKLADYSVSHSPGTTLSYFGYEFDVPWKTQFKEKISQKGGLAVLQFESGQSLVFVVPENQSGLLTEIVTDRSLNMGGLRLILGDLTTRSAYDQHAALLSATPETIRAFGARSEAVRGMTLLTIKAVSFGPGLESGAFTFELPDKRGFQIGDPQKSKRVDLEIFDSSGHHLEISCFAGGDVLFSQPELNRILTSLHSTTASSQLAAHRDETSNPQKTIQKSADSGF